MRYAIATLGCGLAIAACGSSGNTSSNARTFSAQGLKFAQCMRTHGVPNFPDPTSGGQIAITPNEVKSPAFQSAQGSCQKLLPNKGSPPRMTAAVRAAALRFAECMRTHGQPNFPDPLNGSGNPTGPVLVLQGMQFAVGTGLDPKSPAFRQAAQRCGIGLPTGPPGQATG